MSPNSSSDIRRTRFTGTTYIYCHMEDPTLHAENATSCGFQVAASLVDRVLGHGDLSLFGIVTIEQSSTQEQESSKRSQMKEQQDRDDCSTERFQMRSPLHSRSLSCGGGRVIIDIHGSQLGFYSRHNLSIKTVSLFSLPDTKDC